MIGCSLIPELHSHTSQSYESGVLFVDFGGQPARQYTVKTTLSPYAKMCVCVSDNTDAGYQALTPVASPWVSCRTRSRSWNWMSEEGHSRGEEYIRITGSKGKRMWPKTERTTSQPGREMLLWIRRRYKGRRSGGEKSGYADTIFSHWRIHGNLPTSAFWTVLKTERQQMVYIGIIFDSSRQLYFWISSKTVKLRHHLHYRHRCHKGANPHTHQLVGGYE